ncbi:MAG TPA: hypothetical protein VLA75_10670, partial [Thermoanaerobaculia bacterium]|nr:hypothetical protein [Thermoanaerobaculia bacterium]
LAILAATLVVGAVGCRKPQPPPTSEPAAVRVEHAPSGLAVAALPASLRLVAADGPVLELAPADPARAGRFTVEAGPPEPGGINLVEVTRAAGAELAARPEGSFLGQREMIAPWGPAFSARGTYLETGERREELRIFTLHPDRTVDRLVTLTYRYPAGDREESGARFNEGLLVLGELDPLPPPAG